MSDVDTGGAYVFWGAESIWKISVPSSQFGHEPKLPKKKKKEKKRLF